MCQKLLFAYGSIIPANPESHGWFPASLYGEIYYLSDVNWCPGLVNVDHTEHTANGFVRIVTDEELAVYDPIERDAGYTRIAVTLRDGRKAYTYAYVNVIKDTDRGPVGEWSRAEAIRLWENTGPHQENQFDDFQTLLSSVPSGETTRPCAACALANSRSMTCVCARTDLSIRSKP